VRTILLDTNAYSAYSAGSEAVLQEILAADRTLMSTVVLGELHFGFLGGTRLAQNRHLLQAFLSKPGVEVFGMTQETSEIFGEVQDALKRAGTPIPINDVWIAAQTLEAGARLVTLDAHFDKIAGLRFVNPG
jgi:tRNA(fMet)-specific endonuclease VapC